MGFFKVLAYVAGGVGAVVLAPMTGGGSIAAAIGAMGTTTLAGAAIGGSVGAAAAAVSHNSSAKADSYQKGVRVGTKAGEAIAAAQYEKRIRDLTSRLSEYHDFDKKLIALYAIGLAVAKADGRICDEEKAELDMFVAGCSAGNLPRRIKKTIADLTAEPPSLTQALSFAKDAELPRQDIEDVIHLIALANGTISSKEQLFIERWQRMADKFELV